MTNSWPNTVNANALLSIIPTIRAPTPNAPIASTLPTHATPNKSIGIPAIAPAHPATAPTTSSPARFPFLTVARIVSAVAIPGGHGASAGNIGDPNDLYKIVASTIVASVTPISIGYMNSVYPII